MTANEHAMAGDPGPAGHNTQAQTSGEFVCPTLGALTAFADGSASETERRNVRAHLLGCAVCASLAAKLCGRFEHIRHLHGAWLGWKGVATTLRSVEPGQESDDVLQNAWGRHVLRCSRCRRRREALLEFLSPRFALRQAPALALGALVMFVVMPRARLSTASGSGGRADAPIVAVPKNVRGSTTVGMPAGAMAVLNDFVYPPDDAFAHTLERWEQLARENPQDAVPQAQLRRMYAELAWEARGTQAETTWRAKQIEAERKLGDLLSKPAGSGANQDGGAQ